MGAKEAKNTLRSRATARVIDLIAEGELEVIGGDKGVYLDKTPLEEANGKRNFSGVRTTFKTGTKNQTSIKGFRQVEQEVNIGIQVKKSDGAVTRSITDLDADAVLVKIRLNRLSKTNSDTGAIKETKVKLTVYRRNNGGSYVSVAVFDIHGKTNSAYEAMKRVELPAGQGPWDIKVERDSDDAETSFVSNDSYWSSYIIIYESKLTYPYSALCALEVDAKRFGQSFLERRYRSRRVNAPYPSNWNPSTRIYTGIWDGTFLTGTHDNPAWYLWEIMTNDVFGLGDLIKSTGINKWSLYTIAQYCDGLVNGEPRFTFNGYVATRQDAIRLLDSIASVFRGMIYWSAGAVDFAQDSPGTATKLVTPANTIDGNFNRIGSARKARHTAVTVGWNNPKMLGDIDYVTVSRDDLVSKFGYRPKEVSAFGCTSEKQARRMAEWILDTEENETEVLSWQASLDQVDVFPGMLVEIHDPAAQGARFGGRLLGVSGTLVTLDAGFPVGAETYTLNVMMNDGTIESRTLVSPVSNSQTVTLSSAFTKTPVEAAMWTVNGSVTTSEIGYVMAVFERSSNIFEIQAVKRDPSKFARIERGIEISHPDYSVIPSGQLAPPRELSITEYFIDSVEPAVLASWLPSPDGRVTAYEYQWSEAGGSYGDPVQLDGASLDLVGVDEGLFSFQLRSVTSDRTLLVVPSDWVTMGVSIVGANKKPSDVVGLQLNILGGASKLKWTKNTDALTDTYELRHSPLLTGATWDAGLLVAANISKRTSEIAVEARVGTFMIKAKSRNGAYSVNHGLVVNRTITGESPFGDTIDESVNWNGLDYVRQIEDNAYTADWTLSGMTNSGGNLRETATNAVHKVFQTTLSVRPYDEARITFDMTGVGGRNIKFRMFDEHGSTYEGLIDVFAGTVISNTVTGDFTLISTGAVTLGLNRASGFCRIFVADNTEQLTLEMYALSGTSDTYLGIITNGIDWNTLRFSTKNNVMIENGSGDLELASNGAGGYLTSGYYEFANNPTNLWYYDPSVSLDKIAAIRIYPEFEYVVTDDGGVIGDLGSIGDAGAIGGNSDGITITAQVRSSDVSGPYVYGDWETVTDAFFTGQFFQFRFVITSTNPLITPQISSAVIRWEIPQYLESGTGVTTGGGFLTVTYDREFYDAPQLQVTPYSQAEVEYGTRTATDFQVRFRNITSGVVVNRSFDWTATGYGPVAP